MRVQGSCECGEGTGTAGEVTDKALVIVYNRKSEGNLIEADSIILAMGAGRASELGAAGDGQPVATGYSE